MNVSEIEGPVGLLREYEKNTLFGEEMLYEGSLRSVWIMAEQCKQNGIFLFYDGLKRLFPHEKKHNALNANCRMRVRQSWGSQLNQPDYHFFILLFKKYLFHFSYNHVTDSAVKDMLDNISAMKKKYKEESRSALQIEFFLQHCARRDDISIDYESSVISQQNGRLLYELIGKVRVGDAPEKMISDRRHHYPTLQKFHVQAQILAYLKSIPNLN